MSNQHIGVNVEEVIKQRPLQPISRVTVICGTDSDGAEVIRTAGDDSGREFTVSLPLLVGDPVTAQAVATNLLEDMAGYVYQPYEARGALLDPLARLGNAIFAGDVYSVLASRTIELDVLSPSDIAAPAKRAEDHEFPYTAQPDRAVTRRIARNEASIRVNESEIALRVKDATGVGTSLTITPNGAAFADEDGNTVLINGGTLKAGTVEADTVVAGISISAPTITGGDIYGGKYWNNDPSGGGMGYIMLDPNYFYNGVSLMLTTDAHGSDPPIFKIQANNASGAPYDVPPLVSFSVDGTEFCTVGDNTINFYPDEILLRAKVILDSDSYGSSLPTPTAADEGRLFFLVF